MRLFMSANSLCRGILLSLLLLPGARAAEFHVTSPAGLELALAVTQSNGENVVIRIALGTYDTINGGFDE